MRKVWRGEREKKKREKWEWSSGKGPGGVFLSGQRFRKLVLGIVEGKRAHYLDSYRYLVVRLRILQGLDNRPTTCSIALALG
jgi:hypothetical protein